MGSIYSGIGLISGINAQNIVDQLIAIDARPRDLLLERIKGLDAQKAALLDISARITALLARLEILATPASFRSVSATSSLPDVLGATAADGTAPGAYTFVVRALASTHQLVSRGFADRTAPLGDGVLTIESAQARVDRSTKLAELNGFRGVQRGAIEIEDRTGRTASVSLAEAVTVDDVLERINDAGIGVRASLRFGRIVLSDTSGGAGSLLVREVSGGQTAADLGFGAGNRGGAMSEIVGTDVLYLSNSTPLPALNDGLGVRRAIAGGDFAIRAADGTEFQIDLGDILKSETRLERLNHGAGVRLGIVRITARNGATADVDLTGAKNIGDVKTALESAFGPGRIQVVMNGSRLIVTDTAEGTASDFKIEDVSGHAARDLGIAGASSGNRIEGREVLSVDTVGDALAAINFAAGNRDGSGNRLVQASLDANGHGLILTDRTNGMGRIELKTIDESTSHALADLGFQPGTYFESGSSIAGRRIIGGLNSVLLTTLNGGNGMTGGTIRIETDGRSADVDLSGAQTLSDVVEAMNSAAVTAGLPIRAELDATGTRLQIDRTDSGGGAITISDVSGDFAARSGIAGSDVSIRGENLQRRYVSENTRLSLLNGGGGVSTGSFRITNSRGIIQTIDVHNAKTLQDVIDAIRAADLGVEARINDTGDGLLITDTAGGEQPLRIAEDGGVTARDLNILGESTEGRIDGSFELRLDLADGETLDSLATKVNTRSRLATAAVFNDGSGVAPFRLNLISRVSGAAGELVIDDGGTGIAFTTLTTARDARVLLGDGVGGGILITGSSNTLSNVVGGLTLNLNSVSDKPVTIAVEQKIDSIVSALSGLVSDFNSAIESMDKATAYDQTTGRSGVLLGDGAVQSIQTRLYRALNRVLPGGGTITRLSQLGIRVGDGAKLSFDENRFRDAYAKSPDEVGRFFSDLQTGFAKELKAQIETITGVTGLINRRTDALGDQRTQLESRIEQMNTLLDRKRARLLREFQMLETVLSQLQSQSAALGGLSGLSFGTGTTGSTGR